MEADGMQRTRGATEEAIIDGGMLGETKEAGQGGPMRRRAIPMRRWARRRYVGQDRGGMAKGPNSAVDETDEASSCQAR